MTIKIKNPGAAATASEASKYNTPSKHVDHQFISIEPDIQGHSKPNKAKKCLRCNTVKSLSEFRRNTKTVDGYINTCFACCKKKKASKPSYKKAVQGKCKECIYDPIAGNGSWKQQVEACTSPSCPLYHVRPMPEGAL